MRPAPFSWIPLRDRRGRTAPVASDAGSVTYPPSRPVSPDAEARPAGPSARAGDSPPRPIRRSGGRRSPRRRPRIRDRREDSG